MFEFSRQNFPKFQVIFGVKIQIFEKYAKENSDMRQFLVFFRHCASSLLLGSM